MSTVLCRIGCDSQKKAADARLGKNLDAETLEHRQLRLAALGYVLDGKVLRKARLRTR